MFHEVSYYFYFLTEEQKNISFYFLTEEQKNIRFFCDICLMFLCSFVLKTTFFCLKSRWLFLLQIELDLEFVKLSVVDGTRSIHHHVAALIVLREGDDVADRVKFGEH